MAETTGTVSFLKVNKQASAGADFGLFAIRPQGSTTDELFFIWFTVTERDPVTVVDWIARNMHLAMLRDALVHRLPVIVFHDDLSSFYRSLELLPLPAP